MRRRILALAGLSIVTLILTQLALSEAPPAEAEPSLSFQSGRWVFRDPRSHCRSAPIECWAADEPNALGGSYRFRALTAFATRLEAARAEGHCDDPQAERDTSCGSWTSALTELYRELGSPDSLNRGAKVLDAANPGVGIQLR